MASEWNFREVVAPYSGVDFAASLVLVAAPTFEKAPGPRAAFAVPRELLTDTAILGSPLGQNSNSNSNQQPLAPTLSTACSYAAFLPTGVIDFPQISAEPLKLVLIYLDMLASNERKTSTIPEPLNQPLSKVLVPWESVFLFQHLFPKGNIETANDAERTMLSEVLIAADFLGVQSLMDLCGAAFAALLTGKDPTGVRAVFQMTNDLLPDEEKKFRDENAWADEAMSHKK